MSSDNFGPGKKPFKKERPAFGAKKRRYSSNDPQREGQRPPRREGGDRPRPWGDKKPASERREFGRRPSAHSFASGERQNREQRSFSDRGPSRGPRREDSRGPRRDSGSRPEGFQSRGPRRDDARGPRREDGPRGPRRDDNRRPRRNDDSPFRGMYGGPKPVREESDYPRGDRPYRKDPLKFKDTAQEEFPTGPQPQPAGAEAAERPHLGDNELRYLGKNACLGLWKARPDDIVRIYVLEELAAEFSELIEFCAKNRKAYHLVGPQDLERLTDSVHHQGICMIARAKRFYKEEQFFAQLGAHRTLVIYLDGVANPHNLGAILRTAAHFGVKFVCVPKDEITKISPALYRTAEGGAEVVGLVRVEDTEKFLDRLQSQGFHLYAFEAGKESKSLFETRLNEKSAFIFGAEVDGLSGLVRSIVETKVAIPGTGSVESLNVSVAAAVAIAEFEKQGMQRTVRIVKK